VSAPSIDALMVTFRSPESTRRALGRLLESAPPEMRVWVWHNGEDRETLAVVESFRGHPRFGRFHHSRENQRLWAPTNWLLREAQGELLAKIDDDNVVPFGWTEKLVAAHRAYDRFGAIGCWRFQEEDFVPELAEKKIREFPGGHRLLQNLWVEGSCFLMKRRCAVEQGLLREGQTFTQYCKELALARGWIHGWYYPFIRYENLDDPRSPGTLLRTEEDFQRRLPLTAQYNGVRTLAEWTEQLRRSARNAQSAPLDPRYWTGWRPYARRARYWARRLFTGQRSHW
jgi:hypothetical protein